MKSLIIYAHPYEGSFNNFVLSKTKNLLIEKGNLVDVIDLNSDGFNPVMTKDDLKLFSKGEYFDSLASNYAKRLKEADELVLIFPIWWYGEPAILKGFYDKVLLKGHTYDEVDHKLKGLLKADKATILTTANITEEIFKFLGDPIKNVLSNGILNTVGINNVSWIHCSTVHDNSSRDEYLNKIEDHFNK